MYQTELKFRSLLIFEVANLVHAVRVLFRDAYASRVAWEWVTMTRAGGERVKEVVICRVRRIGISKINQIINQGNRELRRS